MLQPLSRPIEEEAAEAAAHCREALADPRLAQLSGSLPGAPADAEGWFRLLASFPHDHHSFTWLTGLRAAFPREAVEAGVSPGHYAALSALPAAASRIASAPVTDRIKRRYIAFIHQIADRAKRWESHFDVEGSRFYDLAHLASLRRFPAGDLCFQVNRRLPVFLGLRVHPLDWPGLLHAMLFAVRGLGPTMTLHFNYARDNWLVVSQDEFERSLWRIAKVAERYPDLKALMTMSWFHSAAVGETFPRLAWMRNVFIEGGAYAVDLEPGKAADICYNSAKRRELYEQGKFCPRQTLVLWPRAALLSWAAKRPELADEGETLLSAPPSPKRRIKVRPGRARLAAKHNAPITLWEGKKLYERSGMAYLLLFVLLPALALASMLAAVAGWSAGVPGFVLGICAAHTFQYYFLQ
jgi:hypothetical protein